MHARNAPTGLVLLPLLVLVPAFAAAGQQPAGFGERPSRELVLPEFSDRDVTRLIETLDAILPPVQAAPDWGDAARTRLWDFVRRLQDGRLTKAQEAQVLEHLRALESGHPDGASAIAAARRMLTGLTVGKQAPDIVGTDVNGEPMRLSDFRGKVVVLKFGGSWCAICRSEYPYERFLVEMYRNWPFALLGVDGSETRDEARVSRAAHNLSYPAWWDGRPGPDERGPIATEWNVLGWPTSYVLDGDGIIRFVDLRGEDLLKAVRQLLVEHQRELIKAGTGDSHR
jgi:thiol-disulfide isomerase/thioredoxin